MEQSPPGPVVRSCSPTFISRWWRQSGALRSGSTSPSRYPPSGRGHSAESVRALHAGVSTCSGFVRCFETARSDAANGADVRTLDRLHPVEATRPIGAGSTSPRSRCARSGRGHSAEPCGLYMQECRRAPGSSVVSKRRSATPQVAPMSAAWIVSIRWRLHGQSVRARPLPGSRYSPSGRGPSAESVRAPHAGVSKLLRVRPLFRNDASPRRDWRRCPQPGSSPSGGGHTAKRCGLDFSPAAATLHPVEATRSSPCGSTCRSSTCSGFVHCFETARSHAANGADVRTLDRLHPVEATRPIGGGSTCRSVAPLHGAPLASKGRGGDAAMAPMNRRRKMRVPREDGARRRRIVRSRSREKDG